MFFGQRAELRGVYVLRGVVAELMIVENEIRGFGVRLLRFPVAVAHLANGEGTVVRRTVRRSTVGLVALLVPPRAAGRGESSKGEQENRVFHKDVSLINFEMTGLHSYRDSICCL